MADWAIIVHGGAREIAPAMKNANRSGCVAAASAGAEILRRGGSAVEAARVAVCILEDDPVFNAGRGSVANADGVIEMDAGIMNGATLDIGAVAAVRRIHNPIDAAAAMLDAPPILLVGSGAEAFAHRAGIAVADRDLLALGSDVGGLDTVGCVARDLAGHIAAATSTGGLGGTLPGRVGDAPLPGCGFYAADGIGGVSLSGDGEAIARTLLAARVMRELETRSAHDAAHAILDPIGNLGAEAGAIVIDAAGAIGMAHNSSHFAVAFTDASRNRVHAAVHIDELKGILPDVR